MPTEDCPTDALLWAQRSRVTEGLSGVSAVRGCRGIVLRGAVTKPKKPMSEARRIRQTIALSSIRSGTLLLARRDGLQLASSHGRLLPFDVGVAIRCTHPRSNVSGIHLNLALSRMEDQPKSEARSMTHATSFKTEEGRLRASCCKRVAVFVALRQSTDINWSSPLLGIPCLALMHQQGFLQ